jgi:hypothetical protein
MPIDHKKPEIYDPGGYLIDEKVIPCYYLTNHHHILSN